MAASIMRMLGVNFGRVDFIFFVVVKAPSVDPVYDVNCVLHSILLGGKFSIVVRHNLDIFVNYKIYSNAHFLLNHGWWFGSNAIWF